MKIHVFYFSPTGGTEKVARLIGSELSAKCTVDYHDVTVKTEDNFTVDKADAAVFCMPVYGGRVPAPTYERVERIQGSQTPAAQIAVFGNRAIDDALLEMKTMTAKEGFVTVAAGEFVAPHSVDTAFGAGRPDAADMVVIKDFAAKLHERLEGEPKEISVPGNPKYREYSGIPVKPSASVKCSGCGACAANCPVGAIDFINPRLTDKALCISCMRCVKICPKGARKVPAPLRLVAAASLKKFCAGRNDAKIYF